jgi:hypothetical protein
MKKLSVILFCTIGIFFSAFAQSALSVQTATIGNATVITPVLGNLRKLLMASKDDFVATVKSLNYTQSKPDDPNTYQASGTEQVYNIDKENTDIDVFFSDNGSYAKKVKDDFLAEYPDARHRSMDGGIEAYYFDMTESGETSHYCIFFDLPADGGGGVTLLHLD